MSKPRPARYRTTNWSALNAALSEAANLGAIDSQRSKSVKQAKAAEERLRRHRGSQSSALRSSLPEGIRAPLADLVRSMNRSYSNLIEGHNTHPIHIERALNKISAPMPKSAAFSLGPSPPT